MATPTLLPLYDGLHVDAIAQETAAIVLRLSTNEGPVIWPRKRRSADALGEGDSRMSERLELINGATQPVTVIYEGDSYRIMKTKE